MLFNEIEFVRFLRILNVVYFGFEGVSVLLEDLFI